MTTQQKLCWWTFSLGHLLVPAGILTAAALFCYSSKSRKTSFIISGHRAHGEQAGPAATGSAAHVGQTKVINDKEGGPWPEEGRGSSGLGKERAELPALL